MVAQRVEARADQPVGRIALGAAGLAILAGSLYTAQPTVALAIVALPVLGLAACALWRWPETLLVSLAFFNSGLFMRESLAVSLPGGRLDGADVSLLALLAIAAARGIGRGHLPLRWWPVSAPLCAYFAVAAFSATHSLALEGVAPNLVLGELRPPLYCLGCVVAASLLTRREQFVRLLVGLFVVADMTVVVLLLQNTLGADNKLLDVMSGGSWQVNEQAAGAFGAIRIVPPGHVLVYLMSILAFCLLVGRGRSWVERLFLVGQVFFLDFGLLLTYTRAQWVASIIATTLAVVLMPREQKARLGRYLLALAPVGLVAAGLLMSYAASGAPMVGALAERFTSILTPDDTINSASLEWRQFEIAAATEAVVANPLLGAGLGNDYRPITLIQMENRGWLWRLDGDGRLTRFVHNSYFYIAAKMGLPGLLALAWLAAAMLIDGARTYLRAGPGPGKTLLLPIGCSFAGILFWSIFEAHLMLTPSMATVGTMIAIAGAGLALDSNRGVDDARAR